MLEDVNTYEIIIDPTNSIQRQNNALVKSLFDDGYIDQQTKRQLTKYNSTPPKIYFLPKHHKDNMPLRPITADVNGPTCKMSKYLAEILSRVDKSDFYIRDSFSFMEFITNVTVPSGHIMISLDVVSLFTKTPILMVKKMVRQRWDKIKSFTNIPSLRFIQMLDLCTQNCYFTFHDTTYRQKFGTPMGSSISPIAVEFVMDYILEIAKKKMRDKYAVELCVMKKYVDDLFLLIPSELVNETVATFNEVNSHIQFTCEVEKEHKLPFLDMCIIRDPIIGTITTNWYSKPMASGRLLNYKSFHPMNQKLGMVRGFIHRVRSLSSPVFHDQNTERIIGVLKENEYPVSLVKRLINSNGSRRGSDSITATNTTICERRNVPYKSLLYIPGVSERIKKSVERVTESFGVAFKCFNTLNSMFSRLKDKLPLMSSSHVVYSVPCATCTNMNYIGTTKQLLRTRLGQHKNTVKNKQGEKSALAAHALDNNHVFDFDNASVLFTCKHYHKRMFLEELSIKTSINCVNVKSKEATNISNIYTRLLAIHKLNSQ
jgi:hypothetical protein